MDLMNQNTVSAKGQTDLSNNAQPMGGQVGLRVLFVGNSITLHGPKPEIGWYGDWGMAASCRKKDYVHVAEELLRKHYGAVSVTYLNCAEWERSYWEDENILSRWQWARELQADVVVIRIGENTWSSRDRLGEIPYAPHMKTMIEYFASNPNATVVVTNLFWHKEIIDSEILKAVEAGGYPLVEIGDLGENDACMAIGQYEHRGVSIHPNDLGMQRIAERLVERIISLRDATAEPSEKNV